MSKAIKLTMLDSGVALLTIDLPGSKMNLLSESVLRELAEALDKIEADSTVKGVIITSGKEDNFGAGANVEEIQALQSQPAIKIYEASKAGKEIFARLAKLNSAAAIHGISLGGFTELALACRYRLASHDERTQIGVPEIKLGFIPGWGGTVRLPKLIGLMNAFPLISTGSTASSKKAWRLGIVDEVVDRDLLVERAGEILAGSSPKRARVGAKQAAIRWFVDNTRIGRALFAKMVSGQIYAQTRGKYPAPFDALKVCLLAVGGSAEAAYEAESQAFAKLATTDVSRNLVRIFFAETESKKMPAGAKPAVDVKVVGVLGAGVMGAGIAQAALYKGFRVVLKDIDQAALDKGVATIKGLFDSLVEKGKMSRVDADVLMSNLEPTLNYADMADCDMVIEAVAEVMKVKKIVRGELDKVIQKPYVFATNTSSLSVSEMAGALTDGDGKVTVEASKYPELVVGIHFFNPVHKMPLVEIVRGATTSDAALACAKAFALKLGKTTVTTNDAPGFVVNRILAPYMREAIVMAEEGVPMADIEKAATAFGMRMGPFTLLDEVGLDIAGHVIKTLENALGERMSAPAILRDIQELKLLGRKGGRGIYLYTASGDRASVKEGRMFAKKKRYLFNPDVQAALASRTKPTRKTQDEIQDRLFLAMVAEAARCLEENVIDDAAQLDLAMIFGTGFPPFTGGPLRWADSLGTRMVNQNLTWLAQVAGANYEPCDLLKGKAESGATFG
ncbi:MAG: enoyl-CoA hydratase/isomerase family protein [Candidatus Melainabacteria bacterium]|nr:enoyl-CoA hydratase/isomerase family protein [Candidatus Melainabacteria bacterium]